MLFLLCIIQQGSPEPAITAAISSSYLRPHISLIRSAPEVIAADATLLLYVSTETGISNSFLILSMTGQTLSISSSSLIIVYPGLADSPPISMMCAPSSIISFVCNKAASILLYFPPSENESGVTFSMPITWVCPSLKSLPPIIIFNYFLYSFYIGK